MAIVMLGGGCRNTAPTTPVGQSLSSVVVPAITPAHDAADVVVATVDGAPVHATCVQAQARTGTSIAAALDQCIAFELLAQAAIARGVGTDAATQLALRRVLASADVARTFEHAIMSPTALPADVVERAVTQNLDKLNTPEWREARYVRANVVQPAAAAKTGGLADADARALATAVYDALPTHHGLTMHELFATAETIGAARNVTVQAAAATTANSTTVAALELEPRPYRTPRLGQSEPAFANALFALAEIGDVSPPVRTPWGWDLIFLSDRLPASTASRAEVVDKIFPDLRRAYFAPWFGEAINGRYQILVDTTPLEQSEQALATPAASAPTP